MKMASLIKAYKALRESISWHSRTYTSVDVPTLLYVRFIFAADKAGGGVRNGVRKRNIYVYCAFVRSSAEIKFAKNDLQYMCTVQLRNN